MIVRNALKKVKTHFKKQGIDIHITPPSKGGPYFWSFEHGDRVASFGANGFHGWDPGALDGQACGFHVQRLTSLGAAAGLGSFRSNVTQLCKALLPDLPKYKIGDLVQGKSTKRAQRFKFAGQIGLVVAAPGDGYVNISWSRHGLLRNNSGGLLPLVAERDVKLLS